MLNNRKRERRPTTTALVAVHSPPSFFAVLRSGIAWILRKLGVDALVVRALGGEPPVSTRRFVYRTPDAWNLANRRFDANQSHADVTRSPKP